MKKHLETVTLNGLVLFHRLALSQLTLPRLIVGGLRCPMLSTIKTGQFVFFRHQGQDTSLRWSGDWPVQLPRAEGTQILGTQNSALWLEVLGLKTDSVLKFLSWEVWPEWATDLMTPRKEDSWPVSLKAVWWLLPFPGGVCMLGKDQTVGFPIWEEEAGRPVKGQRCSAHLLWPEIQNGQEGGGSQSWIQWVLITG